MPHLVTNAFQQGPVSSVPAINPNSPLAPIFVSRSAPPNPETSHFDGVVFETVGLRLKRQCCVQKDGVVALKKDRLVFERTGMGQPGWCLKGWARVQEDGVVSETMCFHAKGKKTSRRRLENSSRRLHWFLLFYSKI